jgi:hypothetical protein
MIGAAELCDGMVTVVPAVAGGCEENDMYMAGGSE